MLWGRAGGVGAAAAAAGRSVASARRGAVGLAAPKRGAAARSVFASVLHAARFAQLDGEKAQAAAQNAEFSRI